MAKKSLDVPVVAFVGRSGCGKTTLIVRLLSVLAEQSLRVGVVKHSPIHDVETDAEGTDTRRFWDAGAEHVALVAHDRVAHVHRFRAEPDLEMALIGIHDVDLVLLEGYKRSALPKIEVIRQACDPRPIPDLGQRIAYVTDVVEVELSVPRFDLNHPDPLVPFLIRQLHLKGH